ncbi:MAG TPA: hypothetical protein VM943_07435, partial [Pyrinomonadaceae bacterium]|nr:hypothetical protein [Pyrinomonadaceae bacterium]
GERFGNSVRLPACSFAFCLPGRSFTAFVSRFVNPIRRCFRILVAFPFVSSESRSAELSPADDFQIVTTRCGELLLAALFVEGGWRNEQM